MAKVRTNRSAACLLVCLLLYQPTAQAQSTIDAFDVLLKLAIEAVDWEFDESWSYTETTVADGNVRVARFDLSLPAGDRWTLLSVDGREPDEDEVEDFLDAKEDAPAIADFAVDVEDMAEPGSLGLLEDTDDYWLFSFEPGVADRDLQGNVSGRAKIIKDGRYLEFIELRSHSRIKAGLGTRIDNFLNRYTFERLADDGPVVPRSVEGNVKGSALLFIDFDETEVARFSDFAPIGDVVEKVVPDR